MEAAQNQVYEPSEFIRGLKQTPNHDSIRGIRILDPRGNIEIDVSVGNKLFSIPYNTVRGDTGRTLIASKLYAAFCYLMRNHIFWGRHQKFILAVRNTLYWRIGENTNSPASKDVISKELSADDLELFELFKSLPKRDQKKSLIYLRFLVATKSWKDGFIQKTVKKAAKFAANHL